MAWIFSLWAQCGTCEEADTFAAHFKAQRWTLIKGTEICCCASIVSGTCCWVRPAPTSLEVAQEEVVAQRTEIAYRLYEHLRSAPPFRFALVGVEVDDVRTDLELLGMARDPHRAYRGMVLTADLWHRAGRPSSFEPFGATHVWRPYQGEPA